MQFEVSPQKILVGFARQVVQAPSVDECLKVSITVFLFRHLTVTNESFSRRTA